MPRLKEYPEPRYNDKGQLLCRAHAKQTGELCEAPARRNYPVCGMHGAGRGDKHPGDANIIHGRRSRFMRERLLDLQQTFLEDEVPEDLTHEIAMLRALLQNFMERISTDNLEERRLLAEQGIGEMEQIAGAARLIDSISAAAARMDKMKKDDAVPKSDVLRVINEMRDAALRCISSESERTALFKAWSGIRLRKVRH